MTFQFFDNTKPPYWGIGRKPVFEFVSDKSGVEQVAGVMEEADAAYAQSTGKDWRRRAMMACAIVR